VGSNPAAPAMIIMVDVAKWLTHRIVAPAFVGSIPIIHPIGESPSGKATDFDSVMRRFDPYLPSQMRSWRNWQTRKIQVLVGLSPWKFKSSRPHQNFILLTYASLAQSAERIHGKDEVVGSIPTGSSRVTCGALEKWLNSPPFQGGIHGFESRTRHHFYY
jgi:hypothetical protein